MKKLLFLLTAAFAALSATGQSGPRFSFSTALGTGISMSEPACTPLLWRVTGYYNVGGRFAAGVGTGLSFYEKTLIPVYADVRLLVTRSRRFTPFLQCGAGYSFAPQSNANGGIMLAPAVGVQYALRGTMRLLLSAGYELQKLERLRKYAGGGFSAQFCEKLGHHAISLKFGFLF